MRAASDAVDTDTIAATIVSLGVGEVATSPNTMKDRRFFGYNTTQIRHKNPRR